jgi:TolB protein
MILYAASRGQLAAVSIDGKVRQSLKIEGGAVREPAWSP